MYMTPMARDIWIQYLHRKKTAIRRPATDVESRHSSLMRLQAMTVLKILKGQ